MAALVLVLPVATWWLVGPLDETRRDLPPGSDPSQYLDYILRAPEFDPALEQAVGLVATTIVAASVGLLAVQERRRPHDRHWLPVVAALATVAIGAGWCGRVFTAGVGGANIGAGVVFIFWLPTLCGLLAFAAWRGWDLWRYPPPPTRRSRTG